MRTLLPVIFSVFLISSVILVSSVQNGFADEVVATSIGFENSVILELKNSRGNTANIDSVRIWLSDNNEFKSFKTEEGWLGKKQLNGVIEFTSQKQVKPGEGVKFGIKTLEEDPTINWKAIDSSGEVISSASTKITATDSIDDKPGLNQPKVVAIKEESIFRFIPEKPSSGSDFRVVGENFVPNQSLDFYIEDKLDNTITVNSDGKFLFTSKAPDTTNDERIEFLLRDSGGSEKSISLRIPVLENREIPDEIKLSLGNTPQQVKRGDTMTLEGMATPNTTLTITSKHTDGNILSIDTIQVGFDGRWSYENLFMPDMELGIVSIEIDDGKSKALRNVEVISAKLINILTEETSYEPGESASFVGTAIPNIAMSVILEDSIGAEIFSRSISIGDKGIVDFNIDIPRGAIEGTYILLAYQENEDAVTVFGVGQEPEPILIVRPVKLNFASDEDVIIGIQGPVNSQVSLILIDSADRERFSDSINLGPDGNEQYRISTEDLPTGSFTLNAKRGESSGSAIFTVGLTTGSGAITIQTTKSEYSKGEQILILGNTGSVNVLLDVTIKDQEGRIVKKIETFSDKSGVFKIDNFRIPSDAQSGTWTISAKSGGNFKDATFNVLSAGDELNVVTDKRDYNPGELMTITGSGARMSSTITIKIFDSEGDKIDELNITAKSNGHYSTIWQIPNQIELGEYEISVDDGASNYSGKFTIS